MGASKEEAMNILKKMPDVEEGSVTSGKVNRPNFEEVVDWSFKDISEDGEIIVNGDKVSGLAFSMRKNVTLSSLIDIYGQPQKITVERGRLDGTFINVSIFYPEKGICLKHLANVLPFVDSSSYRIKPSTSIHEVRYADPSIPDWEIKIGCKWQMNINDYNSLVQDWKGYGEYKTHDY